jgi:CO/xanthine dehydrogenase Mo-binding subunit
MYTNNVPSGAFRGFGVNQGGSAMESQMDVLAEVLGMSPLELRRQEHRLWQRGLRRGRRGGRSLRRW